MRDLEMRKIFNIEHENIRKIKEEQQCDNDIVCIARTLVLKCKTPLNDKSYWVFQVVCYLFRHQKELGLDHEEI